MKTLNNTSFFEILKNCVSKLTEVFIENEDPVTEKFQYRHVLTFHIIC